MDTTRNHLYRAFLLNDENIRANLTPGGAITGSVVDSFDISDVDVIHYMEKRSLMDGLDASDVWYGARRIRVAGTLYGASRAALFDLADEFMAATNAVLAQRESPADMGFRPYFFSKPTLRAEYADAPDSGVIDLVAYALPRGRQVLWQRDQQGGRDFDPLAIPWSASFLMKDPVIYSADAKVIDLSGGSVSGNFANRGNYITVINMLVQVGSAAGSIALNAGGANIVITVPASSGTRIIRYKGIDKMLTVEENSIELPRFDLLSLGTQQSHPVIPAGSSAYTITFTGVTPQAGSQAWYYEAYS